MPSDGFTRFLNMIRAETSKQYKYKDGSGIFDIGKVNHDGSLFVSSYSATLNKGDYLINKSLLELECEFEGDGVTSVKVKNQLQPGESYLIAYVNKTPTVLCQLTRGE